MTATESVAPCTHQFTDLAGHTRSHVELASVGVTPHEMTNREIVAEAFAAWSAGTGYITNLFAPDMRWEIVGRSAASRQYGSTEQFVSEVLQPFGARFDHDRPFRPVNIRGIYSDDSLNTVTVIWDGEGTTNAGTVYRNTYAWIMTLDQGRVVEGTAFYDSIAFNELWDGVTPIG